MLLLAAWPADLSAEAAAERCRCMNQGPWDAFGAVHGVPNLTVADASVLVTQGAGDSPSLTIQALALRSSESLVERLRRGEV